MFSEGILLSNFISWKALYRARERNLGNLLDDDSFINLQYTRSFSTTSEGSDFKQHLSLEKEMATHSSILAWRATVHRVSKSQTRLIDFTFTFSYSFALWFITGYWIQFPVLHSRTLLFILLICNSLPPLIPNSQFIPPTPRSPLAIASLFSMSAGLFLFSR